MKSQVECEKASIAAYVMSSGPMLKPAVPQTYIRASAAVTHSCERKGSLQVGSKKEHMHISHPTVYSMVSH